MRKAGKKEEHTDCRSAFAIAGYYNLNNCLTKSKDRLAELR